MKFKNLFPIIFLLALGFPQLWISSAYAQEVVVKTKKVEKIVRHCKISIEYPILTRNKQYPKIRYINRFLKRKFLNLKKYRDKTLCNSPPNQEVKFNFTLEINYEVKLNNRKLFSVYYSAIAYEYGYAHPNNTYKAFTFDLKTGKLICYRNLFQDKQYSQKINDRIAKNLLKNGFISSIEEFEYTKKNVYGFYLTKDSLNIINIFDVHAAQGVEAKLPFGDLRGILKDDFMNLK